MSAKLRATRCSTSSGGGADIHAFYSASYFADDDEAEVAAVLFRLPDLIRKFESHRRFPPSWGARRKRSAVDSPPLSEKLEFSSCSPTSPLAFSSQADLDSKHVLHNELSTTTGFKKEEGEWTNDRGRSTEYRDQLKMELSDRLMTDNMKLEEPRQLSVCSVSDSLEVQQLSGSQPLVYNQTVGMMQLEQQMGPTATGIPDLNIPAEDDAAEFEWSAPPQPSEIEHHHYRVAAAAEYRAGAAALARQRRHLIQKSKRATRGNRC